MFLVVRKEADGSVGEIKSTLDLKTAGVLQTAMMLERDDVEEVLKELDEGSPDWFTILQRNLLLMGMDKIHSADGECVYVFELW